MEATSADDITSIAERVSDTVCALGVFDGLHRGHRALIDAAIADARERDVSCTVITFSIDPDELFAADTLRKLMDNESRIEALIRCGVDDVVVLPFTRRFASLSAGEFLSATFGDTPACALHVGEGFRFGARAAADTNYLRQWGDERGMHVNVHPLLNVDGAAVSSSRIRALLAKGSIQEANDLLGRAYRLRGTVVPGRQQGRNLGFCTANLSIDEQLRAIGDGVYAAYAYVKNVRCKAAVSVGVSPVFEQDTSANCEVHLLDFEGDIYGCSLEVEFVALLRPMIRFESTEDLIATVMGNINWVRNNL